MKILSLVGALLLCVSSIALADSPKVLEEIRGTVSGVFDGDTLTLHTTGKPLSIRLEGIDAPESGQKFGPESREALKKLVTGKDVIVRKTGEDQYKRTLGTVIVGDINVCAKMVRDGWAWHFNTDEDLAAFETEARNAKRGIWQDDHPKAPWDYRAEKKTAETVQVKSPPKAAPAPIPEPKPVAVPVVSDSPSREGMIWVNGYTRKNGTHVKGYWRRK